MDGHTIFIPVQQYASSYFCGQYFQRKGLPFYTSPFHILHLYPHIYQLSSTAKQLFFCVLIYHFNFLLAFGSFKFFLPFQLCHAHFNRKLPMPLTWLEAQGYFINFIDLF